MYAGIGDKTGLKYRFDKRQLFHVKKGDEWDEKDSGTSFLHSAKNEEVPDQS